LSLPKSIPITFAPTLAIKAKLTTIDNIILADFYVQNVSFSCNIYSENAQPSTARHASHHTPETEK
jgi:hypothetical protein